MEIKQQKRDVFRDARGLRKTKNQFSLALYLVIFLGDKDYKPIIGGGIAFLQPNPYPPPNKITSLLSALLVFTLAKRKFRRTPPGKKLCEWESRVIFPGSPVIVKSHIIGDFSLFPSRNWSNSVPVKKSAGSFGQDVTYLCFPVCYSLCHSNKGPLFKHFMIPSP